MPASSSSKKTTPTRSTAKSTATPANRKSSSIGSSGTAPSKSVRQTPTTKTTASRKTSGNRSIPKNNWIWIVFALIGVVGLIAIVWIVVDQVQKSKSTPDLSQTSALQSYLYQLTGDPTWIDSQAWQILDANNQVIATSSANGQFALSGVSPGTQFTLRNSDWTVSFVGQTGNEGKAVLDISLGQAPIQIPLDKNLDNFVSQFITDVTQNKWSNLYVSVDPRSLPADSQVPTEATDSALAASATPTATTDQWITVDLNDWARGWAIRNFKLDGINAYYNLNKDYSMDGRLTLVWTFTNQSTGEKTIITTHLELVKTDDPNKPYQWVFNTSAFPSPESSATS